MSAKDDEQEVRRLSTIDVANEPYFLLLFRGPGSVSLIRLPWCPHRVSASRHNLVTNLSASRRRCSLQGGLPIWLRHSVIARSDSSPRIWLTTAVRRITQRSRTRCRDCISGLVISLDGHDGRRRPCCIRENFLRTTTSPSRLSPFR